MDYKNITMDDIRYLIEESYTTYNRYNVEITMFENEWQAFCADYNSKHMPITAGKGRILF